MLGNPFLFVNLSNMIAPVSDEEFQKRITVINCINILYFFSVIVSIFCTNISVLHSSADQQKTSTSTYPKEREGHLLGF